MAWRTSSAAALLLAIPATASEPGLRRFQAAEPHMGTLVRITLYAHDGDQARRGFAAAFQRVRELDEKLSDYDPDSELMRLCARAGEGPVLVSDDLYRVLDAAQKIADKTNGKFDVTSGPVTHLWRAARRNQQLPDQPALERASLLVGFDKVLLDADRQTVTLREPGMQLDLGGIAKGFAADEAIKALGGLNITSALVAIGGDIVASGPPPGRTGWRIGIELPGSVSGKFTQTVNLSNSAVSTSGDSEQYLDAGAVRYSHIVDPEVGNALADSIGVTVIANKGIDADSLATAVSVMGADAGLRFIEQHTTAAALVTWRSNGQILERTTSRFPPASRDREVSNSE